MLINLFLGPKKGTYRLISFVMKSHKVEEENVSLAYYTQGHGEEILICIHGHGREVNDFLFLEKKNRKLILIVLPHHGNSLFPEHRVEQEPLTITEFNGLFQRILDKETIKQFHFIGFSQGGRFVLALIPLHQRRIKTVHLISPDGMDHNSFYNKASRNKLARRLFESWENNPNSFIHIAKIALNLKLIRPKVFAFIQLFASNQVDFKRASITWRGFRKITPDIPLIRESIADNKIDFKLIMGKYDQVIRTKQARIFLSKLKHPNALEEISCGHDFFKEDHLNLLIGAIQI